jgi:protocatechuate 3,4-dioxygenase beta subunit
MQDQGSDDTNDSDVNETTYANINTETVMSIQATFLPGEHNLTIDMGIYRLGTVSGTVRVDMDGDDDTHGVNDDVMEGVQMDLIDEHGQVVATVYTDSNGEYQFIDVPQGTYTIREHQPDGYLDLNASSGDLENSDVNEITVVVEAEENDTQNDFDDKLGGKIGDYVWNDTDAEHGANGIQDANESGVNAVHVCLEDGQGNAIIDPKSGEQRCTDTNATGYYEFVGLIPGSYLVVFEIPDGTDVTPVPLAGDDRTLDSNPIETMEVNGRVVAKAPIEVGIGVQDESIDMGLVYEETASIGDYIWNDRNHDGIQDPDEVGIDGIHVILYDENGTKLEEYITHSGGYYQFEHLYEGHYTIEVIVADDWIFTNVDVVDDDQDSDADPYTGKTIEIDLLTGQHQGIWDVGLYCPCANIEGDSADTMDLLTLLLLILITGGSGLFFTRRKYSL